MYAHTHTHMGKKKSRCFQHGPWCVLKTLMEIRKFVREIVPHPDREGRHITLSKRGSIRNPILVQLEIQNRYWR